MARLSGSRVPCTGQVGEWFLKTRPPFWVVVQSTSNPSLVLTVSFRTQQFSVSSSNHSKQNWRKQLSIKEINKAIEQVRSSQAAGVDGTPPKLWKEGGPELHSNLHELLVSGWEQDQVTSDLCDAIIATLYKNNGEISDYSSYSGIILLSIAGKIFAHVLLKRLVSTVAEDHLPEIQCGFRANRGTADIVFVLRQLQEKCKEQNKTVCRVCGPDHIIWHSEQKGIVDDYGLP